MSCFYALHWLGGLEKAPHTRGRFVETDCIVVSHHQMRMAYIDRDLQCKLLIIKI